MMNTKELIKAVKNERGSAFQNCNDCEYGTHNGEVIQKLNRLAELEDKIEHGTLIELPCKVGDTIYIPWDWDGRNGVSFHEIVKIAIYPERVFIVFEVDTDVAALKYGYYSDGVIDISSLGKQFFLTREEAEKRLKELQNG